MQICSIHVKYLQLYIRLEPPAPNNNVFWWISNMDGDIFTRRLI
jgi:hypothetical protein